MSGGAWASLTAWRMWKDGTLPTSARQLPSMTIIVDDPKSPSEGSVALYVRVSSGRYSFEGGGPNKTKKQIRGETQGFVVKNTTAPSLDPSTVLLWAFGILKPV